jgi:hypothetical protein
MFQEPNFRPTNGSKDLPNAWPKFLQPVITVVGLVKIRQKSPALRQTFQWLAKLTGGSKCLIRSTSLHRAAAKFELAAIRAGCALRARRWPYRRGSISIASENRHVVSPHAALHLS